MFGFNPSINWYLLVNIILIIFQLDVLVNNAGRSQRAIWENINIEVDKAIFELNVFSVISLSRLAVRYFTERGGGHLVTMSSLAGVIGAPYSGSYTGTKHAIMVSLFLFKSFLCL